jgi:hypothetical protein
VAGVFVMPLMLMPAMSCRTGPSDMVIVNDGRVMTARVALAAVV